MQLRNKLSYIVRSLQEKALRSSRLPLALSPDLAVARRAKVDEEEDEQKLSLYNPLYLFECANLSYLFSFTY